MRLPAFFRVPPHMVGDLEKSSFSNIEQQSLEFVKYTLEPWLMRWEQSMARRLFSDSEKREYFIRFNVEGLAAGRLRQPHERLRGGPPEWLDERQRHKESWKTSTVSPPRKAATCIW